MNPRRNFLLRASSTLSLRQILFLGAGLGILFPALVLAYFQTTRQLESNIDLRLRLPMQQYAEVLSRGVSTPLWNWDRDAVTALVDSVMSNPDLISVSVTNELKEVFVRKQRPAEASARLLREERDIFYNDRRIGILTIEMSKNRIERELWRDLITMACALAAQVGFSFAFIWVLFDRRLIRPLHVMQDAVARFGRGEFGQVLQWQRKDEIGELARGLDTMQTKLAALIAARQLAETTLRLSEESLTITLHSIGDAVIATDARGLITRMNATAERLTGWQVGQALGRPLPEVFHIIDAQTRLQSINPAQLVMERGETVALSNHTALLSRHGQEYQIADSAAPIRDASGQFVGVVLVFSDVTERYRAQAALRESEAQNRALIRAIPDAIFTNQRDGKFLAVHSPSPDTFFPPTQAILNQRIEDALPKPVADSLLQAFSNALDSHAVQEVNYALTLQGQERHFEARVVPDSDNTVISIVRDITGRKRSEEALRIAATAFESQEGMMVTDSSNVILRINRAFTQITGYSAEETMGKTPRLFKSGRHDAAFYTGIWERIALLGSWQGEIWNRRKDGEVFPGWLTISAVKNDNGQNTHFVATFIDISARKMAEDQIKNLAFYDPLTQLPNRRLLLDRLAQSLAASDRHQRKGALLFVDLDNFKTINDTLGHYQGDLLLVQVARRLSTCVRECDTVARLGGDEFVVMLEGLSEEPLEAALQAETVGEKILASLNLIYQIDSHEYYSTPSVGITLFGDHPESIDEPLKRADLAMYQAKAAGRNTLRLFDPQMQALVTARVALEAGLRDAILHRQFMLHYQPQVDRDGRVTGVEALVRWQHPQRGMVSPAEFIPLAEDTGLILPLGHWVLETACHQIASWATSTQREHLTVAVNVSARQFHHTDFVNQVLAVLDQTRANPHRLKLELTESLLVSSLEDIIAKMSALKARGIVFALDDFGTGYSSLSYLKRLPLDQLKIDQSFVRDLLTDSNDAAIAKTIIALADSLGLAVIAEGVETEAQRETLAAQGCHAYQGFLFSRPVPLRELEAFIDRAS